MSNAFEHPLITVGQEWLAHYAAGGLSPAKRLLIDCQAAIDPRLRETLHQFDHIGGAFLETAKGEPLSEEFWTRFSKALDEDGAADTGRTEHVSEKRWMPAPLKQFLDASQITVNWKKSGPGVERARLLETDNERLYLLKARPGLKMPLHSHRGQEWTLILQGGYHVGDKGFVRGDLHGEDETCMHQPIIDDDGEACVSLVVDDGKLIFANPMLKLLQPFLDI